MRQDRAAEKSRLWRERMNDPDMMERNRRIAEEREAQREAREREIAERNDRAACPCCHAGSYSKADSRKLVRIMIREMGAAGVAAILSDDAADPVKIPADADPVRAALVQALDAHIAAEPEDPSESLDPAHDPLRSPEPARRGRGRPPRVSPSL